MKKIKKNVWIAVPLCLAMTAQSFALTDIDLAALKADYVVTRSDTETEYRFYGDSTDYGIILEDALGRDVNLTLDGVNITVTDKAAIDIGADNNATLTISGTNTVSSAHLTTDEAAIHISDADSTLTITDDTTNDETETDSLTVSVVSDNSAAAIGSDSGSDMSGEIVVTGEVMVVASADGDGAAIGSGEDGDLSGSITIDAQATVIAATDGDGAAIGSGEDGDLSGSITIDAQATVDTSVSGNGMAVGAGAGGDVTGDITVETSTECITQSILYNELGDISAVLFVEDGPTELIESELAVLDYTLLTEDIVWDDIMRIANLSFDKEYDGEEFFLRFHFDKEYANTTLTLRYIDKDTGKVITKQTTTTSRGLACFRVEELGAFVVVK